MSGLAALLAGRVEPGVYRWHSAFHAPDVQHTVEHAGWRFAHLDGWTTDSKKEFLHDIGESLHFPETYGENFDALNDCLRDVKAGKAHGTVLLWDGWGPFARQHKKSFHKALEVLQERAHTEGGGGRFAVLLRGEGPEPDGVESLD